MGSREALEIINQSTRKIQALRLTTINKIFEFYKNNNHIGFVSANIDIFSNILENLLPLPTNLVKEKGLLIK